MTHDISKDIIAVLMNENQLGIAGLGTFTLQRQAALVSPMEGKVSPPSQKVGFNPNLKLDDGKLSRYLRDRYRLSPEEAKSRIEAFVTNVEAQLAAGNSVSLADLGRFSRDYTGEVRFTPGQSNFNKEVFGLPDITLTPVIRAERLAATKHTSAVGTGLATAATSTTSTIPPVTSITEHAKEDWMATLWLFLRDHIWYIAGGTALLFVFGLWYLNQRSLPDEMPENPRINTAPAPTITEPEDRVNIAPVAPETEENPFTPPAETEVVELEQDNNSTNSSTTTTVPNRQQPPPAPPVNVAPTTGDNVAVIAVGRYGKQANVDKMTSRITDAGYTPYTKQENGLTRVGVQVKYLSDDQLERALADIRRRFTKDAFIIER